MAKRPIEISLPEKIVKLASGNDFVLFLSETGQVYSCGNGETGQLGRLSRYASEDGRRGGTGKIKFSLSLFQFLSMICFLRKINYTITYSIQSIIDQRKKFIIRRHFYGCSSLFFKSTRSTIHTRGWIE